VNPSNHARRLVARVALAAGGVGTLTAAAAVARYAAGLYGTLAGVLISVALFGGCGLVCSLRTFRAAGLTRPAPVRLPEPAGDLEPTRTAA
jgi:hypothetical protein